MDADEIASLLAGTSRTFALAIPLLEDPLARRAALAYLLFRIADTLEDGELWTRDERARALRSFAGWIEQDWTETGGTPAWLAAARAKAPTDDAATMLLLERAGAVRGALDREPVRARALVRAAVTRTSREMAGFVDRQGEGGSLRLGDLGDLRRYCYAVAGIVGELLTELFLDATPALERGRRELAALAPRFGEGLQLVNILKDAPRDALDGRAYLPGTVARADVVSLAREDLRAADRYVAALCELGAPRGTIAFCTLPIRLATATLDVLGRGEEKLTREATLAILRDVTRATDQRQ